MKINAKDIVGILPKKLKRICQVGICDPKYLEKLEPVFCYIPLEYGDLTPLTCTNSYVRIQVTERGKNEEEKVQSRTNCCYAA